MGSFDQAFLITLFIVFVIAVLVLGKLGDDRDD